MIGQYCDQHGEKGAMNGGPLMNKRKHKIAHQEDR